MGFYQDERWTRLLSTAVPAPNTPAPVQLAHSRTLGFANAEAYEAQWAATLKGIAADVKAQAQALAREYHESYRALRNAVGRRIVVADLNEDAAVEAMFTSVSAVKDKVDAARSMKDLRDAREGFLLTRGCINEFLAEALLVRYEQMLEDQRRRDEQAQANSAILGYRMLAHTKVRELALRTAAVYNAQQQAIRHMVSVAIDLDSGKHALGRAGHGKGKDELNPALGFTLPAFSASAFSTQDPYNCAELEALWLLKQQVPALKMTSVYFAAMMPGGSPIIPPCANCQRWIREQGATAAKMV